jgi:hypothetical protein
MATGLFPSRQQRQREPRQFVANEIPARRELDHVKRAPLPKAQAYSALSPADSARRRYTSPR